MRIIKKTCNKCVHGKLYRDMDLQIGEYICTISAALECRPDKYAYLFNIGFVEDFLTESEMAV